MRTRKPFDELTIADDIAQQCTSLYIAALRVFLSKTRSCLMPLPSVAGHGTRIAVPSVSGNGCSR